MFLFSSFRTRRKIKREPLNNNGITLTISITAEGFPGSYDPEACAKMASKKLDELVELGGYRPGSVQTCDVILG